MRTGPDWVKMFISTSILLVQGILPTQQVGGFGGHGFAIPPTPSASATLGI